MIRVGTSYFRAPVVVAPCLPTMGQTCLQRQQKINSAAMMNHGANICHRVDSFQGFLTHSSIALKAGAACW